MALPLKVLANSFGWIEELKQVIDQKKVTHIVLGWPAAAPGKPEPPRPELERLQKELEVLCALPVEFVSERLTTHQALRQQLDARLSQKKGRKTVDALAARNLLERYLYEINDAEKS